MSWVVLEIWLFGALARTTNSMQHPTNSDSNHTKGRHRRISNTLGAFCNGAVAARGWVARK